MGRPRKYPLPPPESPESSADYRNGYAAGLAAGRAETGRRLMIATESFGPPYKGASMAIHAGHTRLYDDHEIVQRYPHWFEPIGPSYRESETATAER